MLDYSRITPEFVSKQNENERFWQGRFLIPHQVILLKHYPMYFVFLRNIIVLKLRNTIWHEIRPAVEAWLKIRDKIADSLSADRAKSYREQTKDVIDWIYGLIKSKDSIYFVPDLPR